MLPKIPSFKIVGQSGQLEVAAFLSNFANVMSPVYDVGLDFYCELLEHGSPSGKFFSIQAKTTGQFDEKWEEPIGKKTIMLWLSQPSPVFIILLEKSTGTFFWVSVEENRHFWLTELITPKETIDLRIDRAHSLSRLGDNSEFIQRIRNDIVLINASHGIPNMIGEGYVRSIPVLWLSDEAKENIRNTIRLGFDYLMNDSILKLKLQEAYDYGKKLAVFDKAHYDHFLVLVRICDQLGYNTEAEENYNLAIEICKSDPNWNIKKKTSDASIEDIIKNIETEMAARKNESS